MALTASHRRLVANENGRVSSATSLAQTRCAKLAAAGIVVQDTPQGSTWRLAEKFRHDRLGKMVMMIRITSSRTPWLRVRVAGSGASCHVGYRSCFYRRIAVGASVELNARRSIEQVRKAMDLRPNSMIRG